MKKWFVLVVALMLLISGCGQNDKEKAIDYLVNGQTNDVSVIVFSNQDSDREFVEGLLKKIQDINTSVRADKPIQHINFYDVSVEQKFDYEKLFDLSTYPVILVFEKHEIVLKATTPDEIVQYFEGK
ncbi:hypothetical protein ASD24_24995 [Paenibacillus sp. Root52]|uniref:hypothetical protein n=1 Tax=Paenibacillus sp. Root52 TaxID=1736552 RepID=UPI0006F7F2E9|nr:hypothetical protein [Paenibacillus sp. Root52]KQY90164.1 hypothetical protein ASD24_24995 [Paenibacillus sp. Root52]